MAIAQSLRHDQRGQFLPERFAAAESEHPRGRRVEFDDPAAAVDRDHAVERRIDDRRVQRFTLGHTLFGAASFDELANLGACRFHQRQHGPVDLAGRTREKFDHAKHPRSDHERKREAAVQPEARRDRPARKIRIDGDVVNPRGMLGGEDASGESDAGSELARAAISDECGKVRAGVPAVDVVERLRGLIGLPQDADVPFERLADGLNDARRGVFEVALLRQDGRQRMIGLPEYF